MDPYVFEDLLSICEPHLPPGSSRNGMSLKPRERLLAFLHFLSGDPFMKHEAYNMRTSVGALDRNILTCIECLHEPLVSRFIKWPSPEEALAEADLFHIKTHGKFPKLAMGAIDGTHIGVRTTYITMQSKYSHLHTYILSKGYSSSGFTSSLLQPEGSDVFKCGNYMRCERKDFSCGIISSWSTS